MRKRQDHDKPASLPSDGPPPLPPLTSSFSQQFSSLRYPSSSQPLSELNQISELLLRSAKLSSINQHLQSDRSLISAVRIAEQLADQTHPIVGEVYLQTTFLFLDRAVITPGPIMISALAPTYLAKAQKVREAGRWMDSSLTARFDLVQHRMDHVAPESRLRNVILEFSLTRDAIRSTTSDPLAIAHLARIAQNATRYLLSQEDPPLTMAIPLCQSACSLAASVFGPSHSVTNSLLMQHAELRYHMAIGLESVVERAGELRLIVGSIDKARERYQRDAAADADLLGRMETLLAACHLSEEICDLPQAAESLKRLDKLLLDSAAPSIELVKRLYNISNQINNRIVTEQPGEDSVENLELTASERSSFMTTMIGRCISFSEKTPQTMRDSEFMSFLYLELASNLMRLGNYVNMLSPLEKHAGLELSPLAPDRMQALFFEHTTCLYLGLYPRAHRAASDLIEIAHNLDPERINTGTFIKVRLRLLANQLNRNLAGG